MIFKHHQSKEQGLSDLLNYAHFIDEGVILNKDGAFLISYRFRGPDLHSAREVENDALALSFNRMMTHLSDGWMLHVDELRVPSVNYPDNGFFPETVSRLIDEEQRRRYEAEGQHYENFQFITFVWKFPYNLVKSMRHWFVEGVEEQSNQENLSTLLIQFIETVDRCIGLITPYFIVNKLSSNDLLSYLNTCITGELQSVSVPPQDCFVDVVLGRKNVIGGYVPKIGNKFINVVSILGFLNEETIPGLLEALGTYPLVYRWSNRFIPLSENTAEKDIKRFQRNWNNKVKGFSGVLREAIVGRPTEKINYDALQMKEQTDSALTLNSNQTTRFGYWTSEVVLMHEDAEILTQAIKNLTRYIEQSGFSCIREEVNALDAWLGTIPGHGSCNVRRVFLSSMNLAHVLPLYSIWSGAQVSSSSSLLPLQSPPVFYAATTGKTPFRFHLDVADVGHQVILGPTGAGKSTYLDFLIVQFLRYSQAQIFVFDKDYSHQALTVALDGHHYDVGRSEQLSFCPLSQLETESQQVRAAQFIEDLITLQAVILTPDMKTEIFNTIQALSTKNNKNNRSLTIFRSYVQNEQIRAALKYYTIEGQVKVLDATQDNLQKGYLHTFEMGELLNQKPEIYLPVLRYLFDQIESRLEEKNGANPTLIILEEAWLYLSHEVFARKLKDWLKTLRKKNARVIFATQSLADLYDPGTKNLTGTTAAIMESCPTKVYLPNNAIEEEIKSLYLKMGLSERQLEIISQVAVPKRDYYVVTPEGNRLIELGLRPKSLTLTLIGLSKTQTQSLLETKMQYGAKWLYQWMVINKQIEWAEFFKEIFHKTKDVV